MSGNLDNGVWYNTGGVYDPFTNTWTATSMTDVPTPRIWHVDVWTGEEMIVWGGCTGSTSCPNEVYTGGRYDPISDSWMSTSIQSAPSERANSSAVWTGAEMLVWAGLAGNVGTYTTTGGFYHVSTVPNTPPVAYPDSYTTDEDEPLIVPAPGVLENDIDEDGNPLSALLVSNPIHGSLDLNSDGSFSYTPEGEFNGSDSFNYRVTDGIALSNITTVTITVNALNDLPVAVDDSYSLAEDTSLVVDPPGVLINDNDVDGDMLTAILESGTSHGTLALDADGSFTYTPAANYSGDDSFIYHVSDGVAQSDPATVDLTISPVNDAPVAADDTASTSEDTSTTIPVLINDSDIDGPALSIAAIGTLDLGTAVISGTVVIYTPSANLNGSDSFTYTVSDGALQDTALVTVEITPVNDAPQAAADAYSTVQDTALVIPAPGVLANDADVDGDALTAVLADMPQHGSLVLDADGAFVYMPDAGYAGNDQFTYQADDGSALSQAVAVTITITAPPPPGTEQSFFLPLVRR
jgi:VCBS repeat-containing protein